MHPHLHVGIPELLVFAAYLVVVGGALRLLAGYLATRDSATAQRIAGALGFVY
jgi:hypothetical protein